jgi:hypothetical protein
MDDFFTTNKPPGETYNSVHLADAEELPEMTREQQGRQDHLAQPKWGFIIYRTVYDDDENGRILWKSSKKRLRDAYS